MAKGYYYRAGQRVPVIVAEGARVVRVSDERTPVQIPGWSSRPLNRRFQLIVNDDVVADRELVSKTGELRSLLRLIENREQVAERAERSRVSSFTATPLATRPDVTTFPVAVNESGEGTLISTGEVVVNFHSRVSQAEVERIASDHTWQVVRTLPFMENGYLLRASVSSDPFTFANELIEQHGAIIAHPVFLEDVPDRYPVHAVAGLAAATERTMVSLRPVRYGSQWHLHNTGQSGGVPGVDIDAERAWQITVGTKSIIGCVIDSGVNLAHESLQGVGKVVAGFDFEDNDATPLPTDSNHGTACSALVAAGPGSGEILGVAPGCRLMPIRRPGLTNHLSIAEGFSWVADQGADVLSCSWGIDGRPWILPDVVRASLEYATTHGRSGKGCVIFWAAGNGDELVSSDEWASSPLTIAVAASTDQGVKAGYSDFGPEISICAPSSGGAAGVVTAINSGYTGQFGGTSAAAPIAAGVACLVLSVAPNLRWQEVRDLLQRSARRIDQAGGQYDSSGRSPKYGFGQVDASRALDMIDALIEAERATDTQGLDAGIRAFVRYMNNSQSGGVITAFVAGRRFRILEAIQQDAAVRDAVGSILRAMADAGDSLARGADPVVRDEVWPSVELLVGLLVANRSLNEGNRSYVDPSRTEKEKEPLMTTPGTGTRSLDDAFARLAGMLGGAAPGSTPGSTPPYAPPPTGSTTTSGSTSSASSPASAGSGQREEIAKQIFYSMNMPLITREMLQEMEKELPQLLDFLKSLPGRPSTRDEIVELIAATKAIDERGHVDETRIAAMADVIRRDIGAGSERFVPLVGVILAFGMAGYTIAKGFRR